MRRSRPPAPHPKPIRMRSRRCPSRRPPRARSPRDCLHADRRPPRCPMRARRATPGRSARPRSPHSAQGRHHGVVQRRRCPLGVPDRPQSVLAAPRRGEPLRARRAHGGMRLETRPTERAGLAVRRRVERGAESGTACVDRFWSGGNGHGRTGFWGRPAADASCADLKPQRRARRKGAVRLPLRAISFRRGSHPRPTTCP